jgi:hypothetical protein
VGVELVEGGHVGVPVSVELGWAGPHVGVVVRIFRLWRRTRFPYCNSLIAGFSCFRIRCCVYRSSSL